MDHDEELLEDPFSDDRIHRVFIAELGQELADSLRRVRRFQEAAEMRRHPDEGLRERKRRLTRQRISDVATILFGARGFDNVKVSEVADIVGVSEKTVYNYFPTKESMVLDWADETVESLARVIRECPPSESLTGIGAVPDSMSFGVVVWPYALVVPYSHQYVVSSPFG